MKTDMDKTSRDTVFTNTPDEYNDGSISFATHKVLNEDCIEVFLRSMLKPIVDNFTDKEGENIIDIDNFSFEPLKRLYMQDFYKSLLNTENMYNLINATNFNNKVNPNSSGNNDEIKGNLVTLSVSTNSTSELAKLISQDAKSFIDSRIGTNALGPVEMGSTSFHSCIEYTETATNRLRGLYDSDKLARDNASLGLFTLARLEEIFDEEEKFFKEDVQREHNSLTFQTLARRVVELFARLSNVRMSLLFWTDEVKTYSIEEVTAALDIFYNLMSRISEAKRININDSGDYNVKPTVNVETEDAPKVDILFWIDASGSTKDIIGNLASLATEFCMDIWSINANARIGFVQCNDVGGVINPIRNGKYIPTILPFTPYDNGNGPKKVAAHLNNTLLHGRDGEPCCGNESWAYLQEVVKYAAQGDGFGYSKTQIDGAGVYKNILKDTHLRWSPIEGSSRVVIAFSDELVDNYLSISRCRFRNNSTDPKNPKYYAIVDGYDKTNRIYKQLWWKPAWSKNKNGVKIAVTPAAFYKKGVRGPEKEWHFNGNDENYYHYDGRRTTNGIDEPFGFVMTDKTKVPWQFTETTDAHGKGWYNFDTETKGKKTYKRWRLNIKNNDPDPRTTHWMLDGHYPWSWDYMFRGKTPRNRNDGQDSWEGDNKEYAKNLTLKSWVKAMNDNHIIFRYVLYEHWSRDDVWKDVQEACSTKYTDLMQSTLLKKIVWTDTNSGHEETDKTTKMFTVKQKNDVIPQLRDVILEVIPPPNVTITPPKVEDVNSHNEIVVKYGAAAWQNKAYADSYRPSVFVTNLVSAMAYWANAQQEDQEKGTQYYAEYRNEVCNLTNNKFTWFARTDNSEYVRKTNSSNKFLGGKFNEQKGGDCRQAFTGIHLKCLDPGMPNTDQNDKFGIQTWLGRGFDILVEAFKRCLADDEVMRMVDTSNGQVKVYNFYNRLVDIYGEPKSDTEAEQCGRDFPNMGELQYALMLERIINKVYQELNVKSSSYFKANRPKLNVDFALRYLTDNAITDINDIGTNNSGFVKKYSDVVSYAERVYTSPTITPLTAYVLSNVVTKKDGATRIINPSFSHLLKPWSMCPFRETFDGVANAAPDRIESIENVVGGEIDYSVKYSVDPSICAFAQALPPGPDADYEGAVTHNCTLRYYYENVADVDGQGRSLKNMLETIPPTCPCIGIAKMLKEKLSIDANLISYDKSIDYVHAIFKTINADGTMADDDAEEAYALGYDELVDPDEEGGNRVNYANSYHSNVRLAYLDHLIQLCKDLFTFNQNLMFEEPYVKVKVNKNDEFYYGSELGGSFEPVTCFRFSNFHAQNKEDMKSWVDSSPEYQLKYYGRIIPSGMADSPWVTAINRDLSGETKWYAPDSDDPTEGYWKRETILDNEKLLPYSLTILESQKCHPYDLDSDVTTGVVSPNSTTNSLPTQISRSSDPSISYNFYQIHLMDELTTRVTNSNVTQSLTTYEVYVKRFRPIFLPNANELFRSDDRDPKDPANASATLAASGWSISPHKYTADAQFSQDAIIVPMNLISRNSPRSGQFHCLDISFNEATKSPGGEYISGYLKYVYGSDLDYDNGYFAIEPSVPKTNEYYDFSKYNFRDWLYPASMNDHLTISGDKQALSKLPNWSDEDWVEPNKYTIGEKGAITIRNDSGHALSISQNNLKWFDLKGLVDTNQRPYHQETADVANWLYITTLPPNGGVETSQSVYPLPWCFWHSARGSNGRGPSLYYQGIAHPFQNYENGLCDGDMIFQAVSAVLAQSKLKMKMRGGNKEVDAGPDAFYKGFYDPDCAGSNTKWKLHGSAYYGYPNGSACVTGPYYDRYFHPYKYDGSKVTNAITEPTPNPLFNAYNDTIKEALRGKPMTWSVWNILRQSLWFCYSVRDLDYNKNEPTSIDRHSVYGPLSIEETEYKTLQSIKAMYEEWYKRFTYGGKYTSQCTFNKYNESTNTPDNDSGRGTPWPYKKKDTDPSDYWEAQRLLKGNGKTWGIDSGTYNSDGEYVPGGTRFDECNVEWTNLVADIGLIYNEVSHTHDSCVTMYTGGHPEKHKTSGSSSSSTMRGGSFNGWKAEFYHPRYYMSSDSSGKSGKDRGVAGGAKSKIAGFTPSVLDSSQPFRYALNGVEMCRNFMVLIYRGWNASVPTEAGGDNRVYVPHCEMPVDWSVSTTVHTTNLEGKPLDIVTGGVNGFQVTDMTVQLKSIYPPTEENDTECCDSNFLQRILLPCYPNWEILHDANGNPKHPDAVTEDEYKKIVFSIAPMSYYSGGTGRQVGERMTAMCVSQFFTGEEAEKLTTTLDTEFRDAIAAPNVAITYPPGNIYSDHPYTQYVVGMAPAGMAFNTKANYNPSHWRRM